MEKNSATVPSCGTKTTSKFCVVKHVHGLTKGVTELKGLLLID